MTQSITILDGIPELGVLVKNNDAWVSSRTLTKAFDKNHNHVLRDIKEVKEKVADQFWTAISLLTCFKKVAANSSLSFGWGVPESCFANATRFFRDE